MTSVQRPTLASPLRDAVGAKTANALIEKLGLETVGDLLHHYPRRYAERGEVSDLGALEIGEHVTVAAKIEKITVRPMRQKPRSKMLEVTVTDGRRNLQLTFFNQAWREKQLTIGRWGLFSGKVGQFRDKLQLNQPDYQLLAEPGELADSDGSNALAEFANALIPVYPAAANVPTWVIARAVRATLDIVADVDDPMPEGIRRRRHLIDLATALRAIHQPTSKSELYQAKHRLKWDEAFGLQATLAKRRQAASARPAKARPSRPGGLREAFDAALPFALTAGQADVGDEIAADLAAEHPMHRLLQGEVGSGKTVVAVRAMLQVVDAGGQAALLAPTEVLAAQHARSIRAMLGPMARAGELDAAETSTRVALLTGSLPAAARRAALAEAADGAAGIVVGTHALLSEGVEFADLGLVVIDEQHRFGVEQRDALRSKAGRTPPHVLVMTATPIPRTVAMTVFGDLETSALTQLPSGRSPIATSVVPVAEKPAWLARAWQRVTEEVAAGHQAYVVCPRIGESLAGDEEEEPDGADDPNLEPPPEDDAAAKRPPLAVLDVAPKLAEGPLSELRIGVLHGKLPPDEKDAVMADFAGRRLDVLVATTVIEVGVDVPNSTAMVIMDADRFGVSQLHQLRGRVGRGSAAGLCLLVTDAPAGTKARERLDAVASTTDGFELAQLDLEQRREGDVLGVAQSGRRSRLKLLSLLHDEELIRDARTEASTLVAEDPELNAYPGLAAAVNALVDDDAADYLEKT
ncbi:ATP-dependent DNA helicase RecG [Cryptosporangium aurantiacum]|uniref:ATP-dependent DNA helicase RecG n=1 Tax=Cryptosporangium aurantiacum TaxID=134849 RepID=A0A1M7HS12_9ACTN|nr:ATP-dependent DNA helicase RecG [Cryptosporangium aurantiacum]